MRPGRLNRGGLTLIELVTTVAIIAILSVIGIATIENFDASSYAKIQQDAYGLRENLIYAQQLAVGAQYPVVMEIWPKNGVDGANPNFYFLCFDTAGNGTCGTQNGINIQQPDSASDGGVNYKGNLIKYASFGASSAVGQLSGTATLSGSTYYQTQSGGLVSSSGIYNLPSSGSAPYSVTFYRDGSTNVGGSQGTIYLNLQQTTSGGATNTYNYAITITSMGKIDLWRLTNFNGSTVWVLQ